MKIIRVIKNRLSHTFILLMLLSLQAMAQVERSDNGISTVINKVQMIIQFYDDAMVRIVKSPMNENIDNTSYSVVKKPSDIKLKIFETQDKVTVRSNQLEVSLDLSSGEVSFISNEGQSLLVENGGGEFQPVTYPGGETYKPKQAFVLKKDEKIYGLGQIQNGKLVQRDVNIRLANENMKISIPFFQSDRGYGIYWDDYSPVNFSDSQAETSFESESGNKIDYYFLYGEDADGVISLMRELTGSVPLLPYWSFGYFQSKERYTSQEETVGVVRKYRDLGIPLDGIVQDWQYWGIEEKYWNALEFGNPSFSDPQKMMNDIHDLNAHMIISVWPSFGTDTKPYKELNSKDMLFDFITYPPKNGVKVFDVYNPGARNIVWKYMNDGIFKYGIDGWWLDATEPDLPGFKKEYYDAKTHKGLFREVSNAFPLMTVKGVYDNQLKQSKEKRVFILTRSAFAGQQRYGATSWSGDVTSSWETLRNQIPAGLNFSLTGLPYWNSDIGGFFTAPNYPEGVRSNAYRELYVRWLQFGTFCSMMRSHGTQTPREIFQFGKKGDWAYDAIEKFIKLRYRLLPHIYSTSWQISSNSSTLMRALVMDFSYDQKVLEIDDQYVFGKGMMVCPVTNSQYVNDHSDSKPNFEIIGSRMVYLPAGTTWFDFWTNEKLNGGQTIERDTPIDMIPIYMKSGTILPLGPEIQHTNQIIDSLEIIIYPGEDASYTFYDDERDGYNYQNGAYATITMEWDDSKKVLTIDKREGSYVGMPEQLNLKVTLIDENTPVQKSIIYKGDKTKIKYK